MAETWRSARLTYRAMEEEDEALLAKIGSDPEHFMSVAPFVPTPQGKKDAKAHRAFLETRLLNAVICLPAPASSTPSNGDTETTAPELTPIGLINLSSLAREIVHLRRSEIGISILRQHQGQGYGTEAIEWCLSWGFRHAALHRIELNAYSYNTGAVKLYERMGFTLEGRKRDFFWHDGEWWDAVMFSMLEDEWKEKFGRGKRTES